MFKASILLSCALLAQALPYLTARQNQNTSSSANLTTASSLWDGHCSYPTSDSCFRLKYYLGRWYQVAGTIAPFTADCSCVFAEYSLNDNGTVNVYNGCQLGTRSVDIRGTASPANEIYGEQGVFRVQFPGQPAPDCPGPNYIVQEFDDDNGWAIVQASNFSTLFLLSRNQTPAESDIESWLEKAGNLGSNLNDVVRTNQTGCLFT